MDFHEIKHDDQIGYEEVRAIYLLLLKNNHAHFAKHDIEMLMATVLQRYSIESIGYMSESGKSPDRQTVWTLKVELSQFNFDLRAERVVLLYWKVP